MGAALERLRGEGYAIEGPVSYEGRTFRAVARKVQMELWRWNRVHTLYSETLVAFAEFPAYSPQTHQDFSAALLRYARATKEAPAPAELFVSFFCYPVALVGSLDPATATFVQEEAPAAQWTSAVMPVVYSAREQAVTFLRKTPVWRWDYYSVMRGFVELHLTSGDGAGVPTVVPETPAPPSVALPVAARAPFDSVTPLQQRRQGWTTRNPTLDRDPVRLIVAFVAGEFSVLFLGTLLSTGLGFAATGIGVWSTTGASPVTTTLLAILLAFLAAFVTLAVGGYVLVRVGRPVRPRRAAVLFGAFNLVPALGLILMATVLAFGLRDNPDSTGVGGVIVASLGLGGVAAMAGAMAGALLGGRLATRA